jgi:hypothetical protein
MKSEVLSAMVSIVIIKSPSQSGIKLKKSVTKTSFKPSRQFDQEAERRSETIGIRACEIDIQTLVSLILPIFILRPMTTQLPNQRLSVVVRRS